MTFYPRYAESVDKKNDRQPRPQPTNHPTNQPTNQSTNHPTPPPVYPLLPFPPPPLQPPLSPQPLLLQQQQHTNIIKAWSCIYISGLPHLCLEITYLFHIIAFTRWADIYFDESCGVWRNFHQNTYLFIVQIALLVDRKTS